MRTTRQAIAFDRPFSLAAVDEVQPSGTYMIDVDEELIEGLSFLAYRRVATPSTCRSSVGEEYRCRPSGLILVSWLPAHELMHTKPPAAQDE